MRRLAPLLLAAAGLAQAVAKHCRVTMQLG
jgi:hypothetical protein